MHEKSSIVGYIAAGCFFVFIGSDMVYGAVTGREQLLSMMHLLMGGLAIFALFNHRITEFGVGKEGITIKQKIEAATLLAVAETARPDDAAVGGRDSTELAKEIAGIVSDAIEHSAGRIAGSSVLWVDDRPENNVYERQALEALGICFTISTSTDNALVQLQQRKFDVIISDMGRPPDSRAGYTLLDALKLKGPYPPFVIYAGSNAPKHKTETKDRGGWGTTNRPQQLFELVLSALRKQGKS